ncbi:MAG: hypothetical protein ACM3ZQ_08700 [Bacillota bacterium]
MRYLRIVPYVVLVVAILGCSIALANGSPLRMGPYQMGQLLPDRSTPINVDNELLRFTISDDLSSTDIFVRYTLSNQSDGWQQVKMGFALGLGADKPTVSLGEANLDVEMTRTTVGFLQPFAASKVSAVDPVSGEPIDTGYGSDRFGIAVFDLNLPPRAAVPLVVQYKQNGGVDRSYANNLYTYSYLLQPAAAFQSFHDLTIEMNYPVNALLGHNLPLPEKQRQDGQWVLRGQFAQLPEGDFHFSVMSRDHLWFGQTKGSFYEGAALAVFLTVGLLTACCSAYIVSSRATSISSARTISAVQSPLVGVLAAGASQAGISALIGVRNFFNRYDTMFLFLGTGVALVIVSIVLGLVVSSYVFRVRRGKPPVPPNFS